MDIAGVDVEIDVIKEYPELEDLVVNPSTEDQSFNSSKYGFKSVKINAIKGEELDLTPSTEEQVAMGVFSKVKVNPIESQKLSATPTTEEQVITGLFDTVVVNPIQSEELYAVPSTEEQIKTGLFNTVVVSPIQGETLNLAPTEEQQNFEGVYLGVNINPIQTEEITTDLDFSGSDSIELTAQEGVYIKKATINKDANLTPENIKSGVSIAGISGEVADTSDADATSDDIAKGKSAYVNNEKVVGTMEVNENNALVDLTISTGTSSTSGLNQIIKKIPEDIVVNGTSANYLFNECSALEEVIGLDMSNVTSMISTFKNCTSLKKIDISNTSNVTNMYQMFYYCTSLETISKLDVSEVTNANYMFQGCTKLKSIPVLNFSKLSGNNIQNAFQNCSSLKNATIESLGSTTVGTYLFDACTSLETVDIGVSNTVTNWNGICRSCSSLKSFNADCSGGTIFTSMFQNCSSLESLPESLGLATCKQVDYICNGCTNLKDVPVMNLSGTTSGSYIRNMFSNCNSLTDESLNNILETCISAVNLSSSKTLAYIGLSSEQATRCQSLSNYQAFLDAGWVTGY